MSDHSFERFIQTAKIVLLSVILAVITVAYLSSPRTTTNAQLAMASGFSYLNITTGANTLVKAAPGTLHTIVIASGTATFSIVDTTVAACTGGTTIATTSAATVAGQVYTYDLQFNNGLCIVTSAATGMTVNYR